VRQIQHHISFDFVFTFLISFFALLLLFLNDEKIIESEELVESTIWVFDIATEAKQ